MRIIEQQGRDDLPFRHAQTSYVKVNGLDVPCDGPKLLMLDGDGQPRCSKCDGLLVRTDG